MIPIYEPYIATNQHAYVNDCLNTNWISSRGSYIEKFEKRLSNYLEVPHVITTFNGSVSLSLILRCIKSQFSPNDEIRVGVPHVTYAASISAIMNENNMRPVFLEVDNNYQLNLKEKDLSQIHILIVPQLYGNCPDMDRIKKMCDDYLVYMVEDSAEVFGSKYNNYHLGTLGFAGSYSFFGNKVITTGEGGAIVSFHDEFAEMARHLKNQSHLGGFVHDGPGFNYRMTNIQAAIGLAQLEDIDYIIYKKKMIAKIYREAFNNTEITTPVLNCDSSEWMPLFFLPEGYNSKDFEAYMKNQGIEIRPSFMSVSSMSALSLDQRKNFFNWNGIYLDWNNYQFPLETRGFNLPCYPNLLYENLTYIIDCTKRFLLK